MQGTTFVVIVGIAAVGLMLWRSSLHMSRRLLALAIDLILLLFVMKLYAAIFFGFGSVWLASTMHLFYLPSPQLFFGYGLVYAPINALLMLTIPVIVSTLFESSAYRATPGKILMRMAVSDRANSQPSLKDALIRNAVKWISLTAWPLLLVSIVMVYFKGKALHDYIIKGTTLTLGEGVENKLGKAKLYELDDSTRFQFNDHEEAGAYGETVLIKELEHLKTKGAIGDYGTTDNMVFNNRNFEIDGYAMIPDLGIVVMEAKFYSGKVYPTDLPHWDNIKSDGTNTAKKNPCIQLERTSNLLTELLESKGLLRWPVYSMVVLTHPGIDMAWGESLPKFPVVATNMLEDFIRDDMAADKAISFSEQDYHDVKSALTEHRHAYVDRSPEFAG